MGQLLPILGNSRCDLKPPDLCVNASPLEMGGSKNLLVIFGEAMGV